MQLYRNQILNRLPVDKDDWDWEISGRALIEYCGIPLAIYMAAGVSMGFLQTHGLYDPFIDPTKNFPLYYILNFWLVGGVYWYRTNFQQKLLLDGRNELLVAGVIALTWLLTQPLLLLFGYGFYIVAVMNKDRLHGSFFPDLTDVEEDMEEGVDDDSGTYTYQKMP